MRILLTGASGFIGSALTTFLAGAGHEIVALKRTTGPSEPGIPSWDPATGRISLADAGTCEAVIHLAGENIAQRWTPAAKARIRDSRIKSTRLLIEALVRVSQPPKIFVCASATGYYGNRGSELLDERSAGGEGFLAGICRDWEAATLPAAQAGMRVVNLRLGIVLDPRGGALEKMLPPFRAGLGGKLGDGRQYWSWITLDDLLAAVLHILRDHRVSGPVNAVSPSPVTNAEFTRALGEALHRPTMLSVPGFVLKLLLGEMAEGALLASCRVRPLRLEETGFVFRAPELGEALMRMLRV